MEKSMTKPSSSNTMNGRSQASCILANGKAWYRCTKSVNKLKSLNICNIEIIKVTIVGMINAYFSSKGIKILINEIMTKTIEVG